MVRAIIAPLVFASVATAFTGGVVTRAVSQRMSMSTMVGSSAPLGFFDPLGFSKKSEADLIRFRESELKHGRTAMLAVFGVLTQERFHPLYDNKPEFSNPHEAAAAVPPLGWVQIVVLCGVLEYAFLMASKQEGYKPGDYFGITARLPDPDDASWVDFQTRELNNGRLAMFAIMGELTHAIIQGKGPLEGLGL
mmetsp:Transcript_24106/g.24362  ORF Transcript_24106/g.24362 Transcript_24106/m.24362 type:complete len:193 (+) Transcript_24106:80-658(+)|eukprot:CAMPEP_0182417340 /NCGR_PEP_ID=MMETSP1167-20130531/1775_1 /TAXON_ID=2988 /ORGANISM="Mallomonas Sp, Strain CCMP3275" /LENGTH=192 /DNA_ID=CAMNT_0024590801 /DNA_START=72 /DNA_END=650 /DNA_ORIENTATION=+